MSSTKFQIYLRTIRLELLGERGYICEACGDRSWTDLHHGILSKDSRFPDKLYKKVNLMCTCHTCNTSRVLDNYEMRRLFCWIQELRGYNSHAWLASLPLRVKPDYSRYICNIDLLSKNMTLPFLELVKMEIFK
jgi:hypothetical protein